MIESNLEPSRMCCFCCCGGSGSDWCGRGAPRELRPCTLRYRVADREAMYATRRDDLFRRDVAFAYVLFILMAAILLLTQQRLVFPRLEFNFMCIVCLFMHLLRSRIIKII